MDIKRDMDNFPTMGKKNVEMDYSKQVLPMSGGIVSTVLLYYLKETDYTVYPICFDWGKLKLIRSIDGANRSCNKLGFPLKTVDVSGIGNFLEEGMNDPHIVGLRDILYLDIACSYAIMKKAGTLHYPIYIVKPELRDNIGRYATYLRSIIEGNDRASGISNGRVQLAFNFWQNEEYEIIEIGETLNVDWNDTWSCMKNKDIHCGKCLGCLQRKESFKKANIKDPTIYGELL